MIQILPASNNFTIYDFQHDDYDNMMIAFISFQLCFQWCTVEMKAKHSTFICDSFYSGLK